MFSDAPNGQFESFFLRRFCFSAEWSVLGCSHAPPGGARNSFPRPCLPHSSALLRPYDVVRISSRHVRSGLHWFQKHRELMQITPNSLRACAVASRFVFRRCIGGCRVGVFEGMSPACGSWVQLILIFRFICATTPLAGSCAVRSLFILRRTHAVLIFIVL